jgi:hypothetical protein
MYYTNVSGLFQGTQLVSMNTRREKVLRYVETPTNQSKVTWISASNQFAGQYAAASFGRYATQFYIDHLLSLEIGDPLWRELSDCASSGFFQDTDESPLHVLFNRCYGYGGHLEEKQCHLLIRQLLAYGYELDHANNPKKRGAIFTYCCQEFGHSPRYKPAILLLLELGANPNLFPQQQIPPFKHILLSGDQAVLQALINHPKFDFDSSDANGRKPIHHVVELGRDDLIHEFLERAEIDINAQDTSGRTALHISVIRNKDAIVKKLLSIYGVRIYLIDGNGRTPLALATY